MYAAILETLYRDIPYEVYKEVPNCGCRYLLVVVPDDHDAVPDEVCIVLGGRRIREFAQIDAKIADDEKENNDDEDESEESTLR